MNEHEWYADVEGGDAEKENLPIICNDKLINNSKIIEALSLLTQ